MPRQKACCLGGDHASLDADQRCLGFIERQPNHLQPVVALVKLGLGQFPRPGSYKLT
jgi:hypothetical protein